MISAISSPTRSISEQSTIITAVFSFVKFFLGFLENFFSNCFISGRLKGPADKSCTFLFNFSAVEKREYYGKREFTAEEYAAFVGTHCTHIVISEPYKTKFFDGIKKAVLDAGNKIVFNDTFVLYLTKKPL